MSIQHKRVFHNREIVVPQITIKRIPTNNAKLCISGGLPRLPNGSCVITILWILPKHLYIFLCIYSFVCGHEAQMATPRNSNFKVSLSNVACFCLVLRFGYIIHEFDPWFNYRAAVPWRMELGRIGNWRRVIVNV